MKIFIFLSLFLSFFHLIVVVAYCKRLRFYYIAETLKKQYHLHYTDFVIIVFSSFASYFLVWRLCNLMFVSTMLQRCRCVVVRTCCCCLNHLQRIWFVPAIYLCCLFLSRFQFDLCCCCTYSLNLSASTVERTIMPS